jgi:hypothetical protein
MKIPGVLLLIFLVGCSNQQTLSELEAEAMATGDWTAVEQRERINERMRVQSEPKCAEGFYNYCRIKGVQEICSCESVRNAGFYE